MIRQTNKKIYKHDTADCSRTGPFLMFGGEIPGRNRDVMSACSILQISEHLDKLMYLQEKEKTQAGVGFCFGMLLFFLKAN